MWLVTERSKVLQVADPLPVPVRGPFVSSLVLGPYIAISLLHACLRESRVAYGLRL